MYERDGYPPGCPCWVDTSQPDPEAAVAFYSGLFGWEFTDRAPTDAPGHYFVAQLRGGDVAAVGSQPVGAPPNPNWNTYVWVDGVDDAVVKVIDAGGRVLNDPFEVGEAGRMAVVADREGATLCLWQAKEHRGARRVNEPGAWNSSDLNTRDRAGAEAFYGAVFGWEATSLSMGGMEFAMWRLPGYGDYLEANVDPDIRSRQASEEAPEGFEDAVAWLTPMGDDAPADAPANWGVDFSVDDADAAAERAARLGGSIVTPPFDAGPVRFAILADPAGAVLRVGKYTPPS